MSRPKGTALQAAHGLLEEVTHHFRGRTQRGQTLVQSYTQHVDIMHAWI